MQKSNAPTPFTVAFANGAGAGFRNTIPIPSQIPVTPAAASYTDGFPPVTMEPTGSGGIPPYGADMNGILYAATLATLWEQAGFMQTFSSSLSTSYGGYPAQSLLIMGSGLGLWLNTSDNNTTSPDATGSSGWTAVLGNAGKTVMNVTGGIYTPDPSVLGVKLLYLQGTLTSNLTLTLPLTAGSGWKIYNNTSGAFTVTAGGASGATVVISQGGLTEVVTDGTNFYTASIPGGPYLPLSGTAVAATKLATARTIAMSGDVVWSVNFDGSANVTAGGTIQPGAVTLAKMATFQANSLMGNPTASTATPSAITLTSGIQFISGALGLGGITVTGITNNGTESISLPVVLPSASGSFSTPWLFQQSVGSNNDQLVLQHSRINTGSDWTTTNISLYRKVDTSEQGFIQFGEAINGTGLAFGSGSSIYLTMSGTGTWAFASRPTFNSATPWDTANRSNPPNSSTTNLITFDWGVHTSAQLGLTIDTTYEGYLWHSGNFNPANYLQVSGGTITGNLQINGTISSIGTANFNTSDATLKVLTPAEPRPLHRAPWYAYKRIDTGQLGRGPTAQSIAEYAPDYVREYDHPMGNGQTARKLQLAKDQVALETAFWAAIAVERLEARLAALEIRL